MRRFLSSSVLCAVIGLLGSARVLQAEVTFEQLNAVLGAPLFGDNYLWDDSASEVAARLRWPKESETASSSSYRKYAGEDQRWLGARPYSLALYGVDGAPASLSVVFANKGDYGGLFEINRELKQGTAVGRDHTQLLRRQREAITGLDKAMENDASAVEKALTQCLGKPVPDKFGTGRSLQERVNRWDWNGHAFLLSKRNDSHVGLRIVPVETADNGGRDARISASELKKQLKGRVEWRPNGDVVVGQLPMVNQGPKGFCVPATMERYLRYMGIQSDMYVLALAAHTQAGGGTYFAAIEEATSDLVRRNQRKLEKLPSGMSLSSISRQIDQGLPIIWGLFIDPDLDREITARSRQRKSMEDPKAWREKIKKARYGTAYLKPSREHSHACLVIGYNSATEELAISDSWGPEYAERWITLKEAEAVSMGYLRVISW